jgi:hypothetical protein
MLPTVFHMPLNTVVPGKCTPASSDDVSAISEMSPE